MTTGCGCVGIHDGLTHEEHVDIRDEATNRHLLLDALAAGRHAESQAEYAVRAEIRRLAEKVQMMKAGLIRDPTTLSARDRRALDAAREGAPKMMTLISTITCDGCGNLIEETTAHLRVSERGAKRKHVQRRHYHFHDRECLWHWVTLDARVKP